MTTTKTATCLSCGTSRPLEEMVQALTPSWRPIPDGWQCQDAEACYQTVLNGAVTK